MASPGRCGIAITFDDLVSSTGAATAKYPLGTLRVEETSAAAGCETYRYVVFDNGSGNVAAAAGALCYRGSTAANIWDVTSDVSTVHSGLVVGAFQSVLTDGYYGWVKTKGYQSNLKKQSGSGFGWTKGHVLYASNSATADGKAINVKLAATSKVSGAELRAALQRIVGWASANVSSTTGTGGCYISLEA